MVPTSISLVDLDQLTFGEQTQDGALLARDLVPEVVVHTGDMVIEGTVDNGNLLVKGSVEFLDFIDKLQAKVLKAALEYRDDWFNYKANISESGVKTMLKSYRTDDVVRLRAVNTVFYDENKNVVDETAMNDKQRVRGVVKFTRVFFGKSSFGVTPWAVQIKAMADPKAKDVEVPLVCLVDDSEDAPAISPSPVGDEFIAVSVGVNA
jgi:hypothetical protein